jgi:hypothetical protein
MDGAPRPARPYTIMEIDWNDPEVYERLVEFTHQTGMMLGELKTFRAQLQRDAAKSELVSTKRQLTQITKKEARRRNRPRFAARDERLRKRHDEEKDKYGKPYSYERIAREMGLSRETVRQAVYRARKRRKQTGVVGSNSNTSPKKRKRK